MTRPSPTGKLVCTYIFISINLDSLSMHVWVSKKLHLDLSFEEITSNDFFRAKQNKIFNQNLLCHDHRRWVPASKVGIDHGFGWTAETASGASFFEATTSGSQRSVMTVVGSLFKPTGQLRKIHPISTHFHLLSELCSQNSFTLCKFTQIYAISCIHKFP